MKPSEILTREEPRFTAGPWKVLEPRLGCFEIAGPKGEDLGFFNESDGADEPEFYPARQNATLSAAAPELYEALKAAMERIETLRDPSVNGPWNDALKRKIDAALAKAEDTNS